MEVIPNVYLISGTVVNCYLIAEPDGLTLIDTGLPSYESKIRKTITALGYTLQDLKNILLTHSDGDHVGSLAALKASSGAKVYASAIEAQAIEAGIPSRKGRLNWIGKILHFPISRFFKAAPCKVDHILTPGQDLPILERLWVVPTPGHTPGHISFYSAAAKILFAGDSVRSAYGKLICSSGKFTWNEKDAFDSMRLQEAMKPQTVCVGHGPVIRNAVMKFESPA